MTDQMTPAELRAAAAKMTSPWHGDDRVTSAADDHDWWAALKTARDATRRLADVIEYAEPFAAKQFAGFAAMWDAHPEMVEVVRIARGETNEGEKR